MEEKKINVEILTFEEFKTVPIYTAEYVVDFGLKLLASPWVNYAGGVEWTTKKQEEFRGAILETMYEEYVLNAVRKASESNKS